MGWFKGVSKAEVLMARNWLKQCEWEGVAGDKGSRISEATGEELHELCRMGTGEVLG